jgi:glycosyltransferase involved in cell wall biosynthesis
VVEAVSLGVPVVGYSEALEGLELAEGDGILVARDAREFTIALRRLLGDEAERLRLIARGRERVLERYGWSATYGRFPELYSRWCEEAARPPRAPAESE